MSKHSEAPWLERDTTRALLDAAGCSLAREQAKMEQAKIHVLPPTGAQPVSLDPRQIRLGAKEAKRPTMQLHPSVPLTTGCYPAGALCTHH